jgi:hypothetical protein
MTRATRSPGVSITIDTTGKSAARGRFCGARAMVTDQNFGKGRISYLGKLVRSGLSRKWNGRVCENRKNAYIVGSNIAKSEGEIPTPPAGSPPRSCRFVSCPLSVVNETEMVLLRL